MKRFRMGDEVETESINMANVLMLLSRSSDDHPSTTSGGRVFECKTCSRQFPSFQALGGHRASHKKPRLLTDGSQQGSTAKPRVHECSVCGLEFAIGQALGGHMRRHRAVGDGEKKQTTGEKRTLLWLDLNLPPSDDEDDRRNMVFGIKLVEGSPLVDCFH